MSSETGTSLREQAADWVVRLDTARDDAALQVDCAAWRAQSAEHERTYQQCRQLWQAVSPAPRRRLARRAGTALGTVVLLVGLSQLPWALWTADARAPDNEMHAVALADGSRIVLNRGSAVDLHFDERARTVRLIQGEVLAEVAPDAAGRPFRVIGRDGIAQARGTRYLVAQRESDTVLTVIESTVTATPAQQPGVARDVHAGERLRFDASRILETAAAPPSAGAWTRHRLVFENAPLPDVLAALEPYRSGWLRASGEAAAGMRFTGVLPTDDPDAALDLLQRALPLQARRLTPYWVWLEARTPQVR